MAKNITLKINAEDILQQYAGLTGLRQAGHLRHSYGATWIREDVTGVVCSELPALSWASSLSGTKSSESDKNTISFHD